MPFRITRDAIYFGDTKLPGLIAQDGVVVAPGGIDGFNTVSVTFIVGDVQVEDPTLLTWGRHFGARGDDTSEPCGIIPTDAIPPGFDR